MGKEDLGLTYRGYSIGDLAAQAFEEVAYLLLLYGHLPNRTELEGYQQKLASLRGLPGPENRLEQLPAAAHPMDVCAPAVLPWAALSRKAVIAILHTVSNRMLARHFPILLYWYQFHQTGQRIETPLPCPTWPHTFSILLLG